MDIIAAAAGGKRPFTAVVRRCNPAPAAAVVILSDVVFWDCRHNAKNGHLRRRGGCAGYTTPATPQQRAKTPKNGQISPASQHRKNGATPATPQQRRRLDVTPAARRVIIYGGGVDCVL